MANRDRSADAPPRWAVRFGLMAALLITIASGGSDAVNDTVRLQPGLALQAIVNAHPPGTVFVLAPGVYRMQTLTPRTGDTFIGEQGAILSGAALLTTFTREGRYWIASDQTQHGSPSVFGGTPQCKAGYPRCGQPEDVFVDDQPLRHVGSLDQVTTGTWFFDYQGKRIVLADDPAGRRVETSVTRFAFQASGVDRVTIRDLVIEKYANPAQAGAIFGDGVSNWLVDRNELRLNHGAGVSFSTSRSSQIVANHVHHNGQLGIGAWNSDALLVEGNEIDHNNFAGFDSAWEAGGAKFAWSRDLVVRRNMANHNVGKGLWTDGDNIRTIFDGNVASDNSDHGIFHEISYQAIIRNNVAERNGLDGIAIATSADVEVSGNQVGLNGRMQIAARQDFVGRVGRYGPLELRNLYVHDNVVTVQGTQGAVGITTKGAATFIGKNNRFVHNTYILHHASASPFMWSTGPVDETRWRRLGQDVNGSFNRQ